MVRPNNIPAMGALTAKRSGSKRLHETTIPTSSAQAIIVNFFIERAVLSRGGAAETNTSSVRRPKPSQCPGSRVWRLLRLPPTVLEIAEAQLWLDPVHHSPTELSRS